MAGRGETVKYVIEADTSDFTRGMAGAAASADAAGRRIDRSLTSTSKRSENNFSDIRRNAATAASSIRNFGVAFQAFNTTSAIIGITALAGAVLELSGALAAAGSTVSIFAPLLTQGLAATGAFKAGVSGLSDAFDAIAKNDGKAFQESLRNLGPAATSVALAFAGLNRALNSIKLNTQQALLAGMGDTLLQLGANVLPTVNAGFQIIGQSMNRAAKEAAAIAGSPAFSGLLSAIFADTARTIDTLSGALQPLVTMFTYLYAITAPYVQLLAEFVVNLANSGAAYLSSSKGQQAFNASIMYGVIALQQLGNLIGAIFGLLTSIFRTSVESGTSLIGTLTGIIQQMTAWVNSAEGQAKLTALFQVTSTVISEVAQAVGQAVNFFLGLVSAFNALNPGLQQFIVGMLASGLIIRPVLTYVSQLYLAFRVLAVSAFNVVQQAIVVASALGGFATIALILAGGLVFLSQVIGGPLGSALLIIGFAIATYIGLSYLMTAVSNYLAGAMIRKGQAAIYAAQADAIASQMSGLLAVTMLQTATAAGAAGAGLTLAARGAMFLQAALLPLLVLAAGILIILGMLGVFSGKASSAGTSAKGLGSSLSGLNKSLKGVGASGGKAATGGLAALDTGLQDVGTAAQEAQKGLAGFDKMNVLTDKTAGGGAGGLGGGIPNVPALPAPDFGGAGGGGGLALPEIDTGDFDKTFGDLTKQFEDLQKKFDTGFSNPFEEIGKFISANPLPFFIAFVVILGIIIALFATGAVTIGLATLPLTLIVIAIIAIIAIVILLVQNWSTVWAFIQSIVANVGNFIKGVMDSVFAWISGVLTNIGNFFQSVWTGISDFVGGILEGLKEFFGTIFEAIGVALAFYINIYIEAFKLAFSIITTVWNAVVGFFQGLWTAISAAVSVLINAVINYFKLAWLGVQIIWAVVVAYFQGLWNGIVNIFNAVVGFFGNVFQGAWNAVKNAFSAVTGFFQGIWNTIVSIFGRVGTAVGDAIGGAFKGVVNGVINMVSNTVNTVIDLINGAIGLINKIPGVSIGKMPRVNLPRLAKGGIVTSSTFAEIGENGAEAVVPLQNNTEWIDMLADKINGSSNSGQGQPLNVTVELDGTKLGQIIIDKINEKTQMSGRNQVLV